MEARLKYSKSTVVQTDPFHPLVGCHQLEQRLLDDLLQQLLSSMQTEQPRIVGRLLELMDPKNRWGDTLHSSLPPPDASCLHRSTRAGLVMHGIHVVCQPLKYGSIKKPLFDLSVSLS